jgi:hypothetical protein
LTLSLLPSLIPSSLLEASVTPDDGSVYYALTGSVQVSLTYARIEGIYAPRVAINRIDLETGALLPLAYAGGVDMIDTCVSVSDAPGTLVVSLQPDDMAFNPSADYAAYTLHVAHAECHTTR